MTYNPFWIEPTAGGLCAYFMPEDEKSTLSSARPTSSSDGVIGDAPQSYRTPWLRRRTQARR